jgi:hypothetical protein
MAGNAYLVSIHAPRTGRDTFRDNGWRSVTHYNRFSRVHIGLLLFRVSTLGDHLKTGQRGSPENRPTEVTQDKLIYTLPAETFKVNYFSQSTTIIFGALTRQIWLFRVAIER